MSLTITRTRLDGPAAVAAYQLEAHDGEALLLRERLTVSLMVADPLAVLAAGEAAFQARAETVAANRALMPE